MSEETEQLTGKAEREAFMGYESRPTPEPEEPKTYPSGEEGIRQAANDVTRERAATTEAPLEKIEYTERPEEGKKYSLTAEQAAKDLSDYHRQQAASAEFGDLSQLANDVDAARSLLYGAEPLAGQPGQPAAEAPQPTEVPEAPVDGLDPDIAQALSNPKIRAFAEQQLGQLSAAEQAYVNGLAHNAATTAAYLLAEIPEFQGLSLEQANAQMQILRTQNPARAYEISQRLEAPRQLMLEAQRVEAQRQARAQHEAAARLKAFRDEQDQKILKVRPELSDKAVAKKYMDAAPTYLTERGFSRNDLEALMTGKAGLAIFDARMQDILIDAMNYRAAKAGIANPPTKPIPNVQKPGNGRSSAERSAAQIGSLREQFKSAKGQDQLRLGVELMRAKRAARGR